MDDIQKSLCVDQVQKIWLLANPFEIAWAEFMCALGFSTVEIASEIEGFYASAAFLRLRKKLEDKTRPLSDADWEGVLKKMRAGKSVDEIAADINAQSAHKKIRR